MGWARGAPYGHPVRGQGVAALPISYFAGYDLISRSGMFDAEFYRRRNPEVDRHGYDPVAHYLEVGARAGRDPHPDFDTAHYRAQCVALGETLDNPLIHYLQVGKARGLLPHPRSVDQEIRLHCDYARLGLDGRLELEGWTFDSAGIQSVVVLLDDVEVGAARFGLPRPDVAAYFSAEPAARNPAFAFVGAAPSPEGAGFEGEYRVAVRVLTLDGRERVVSSQVTAAQLTRTPGDEAGAVRIDPDVAMAVDAPNIVNGVAVTPVRASLSIAGWAFARRGVDRVEISIDGERVTTAYYGVRRDDVAAAFPEHPEALLSGFAALLPNRALPKGEHRVGVAAFDRSGAARRLEFGILVEEVEEESGPWSVRRRMPQSEIDLGLAALAAAEWRPAIAILLRVGAGEAQVEAARRTLKSLGRQAYDTWRVLISPVGEADRATIEAPLLAGFEDLAPRVDWLAADAGLEGLADLVGVLAAGDELGVDALLSFAVWSARDRAADFIYADERRFDAGRNRRDAFFKPDWSPNLLLSTNYIGRFWLATPGVLSAAGVTLVGSELHGDYDLVLRCVEQSVRISHLPAVLGERAETADDAPEVERAALERALERRGVAGSVQAGASPGLHRVARAHAVTDLVSIIIPTCAARGLIRVCLETIRRLTAYRNFEIVCIENIPAADVESREWLLANADRVVSTDEPFNWSRFNNLAAAQATGAYLVFLNDDIEIVSPDWLDVLLSHAARPEVGIAGPLLLYPDQSIQHAGLFLTHNGTARHAFRFAPPDDPGPFGLALAERDLIGVTGACMMVRREVFEEAGRFDEAHSVINNDVDFCLRVHSLGRQIVYAPSVRLIHHELASRSEIADDYDSEVFDDRWAETFARGDPFFNPRLSKDEDGYGLDREPVRIVYPSRPLIAREAVRRLLLLKVDHIGDCVTALPAVRRLRSLFPNARISVLAAASTRAVWSLVDGIDEVIPFQFFHTRSGEGQTPIGEAELTALRERLTPEDFDLAIDLRKSPDSRRLLLHTGATYLAGFGHGTEFPWLDITVEWEGDPRFQSKRAHISEDLLRLVQAVELACDGDRHVVDRPRPAWPILDEDLASLGERPVVVIHPAAGTPTREWPPKLFAQLIDMLVQDFEVNIALVGGPGDEAIAQAVFDAVRHKERVTSLLGRLTLAQLADFLPHCALFVGNNSGPSHLAAALGVPTVAVHSGVIASEEWGPNGPLAVAIRRDMSCAPCYISKLEECHRKLACLTRLTPGDVLQACAPLLLGRTAPTNAQP